VQAIPIPFSGYANFHGDAKHFHGDERTSRMFAYRSFVVADHARRQVGVRILIRP
jgi:hypothetical protein